MTAIKVTAEDLHNLGNQVNSGASNINTELGQLARQVNSVVGSDWDGAASSQFHILYEEWQHSAAKLQDALTGISRLLIQAGTQYANTEEAIRSSMMG